MMRALALACQEVVHQEIISDLLLPDKRRLTAALTETTTYLAQVVAYRATLSS